MAGAPPKSVSLARRTAASASLLGAAGIATAGAIDAMWWPLLALAGMLGGAAVGLSRKSLTVQILSRGMTWLVFAPASAISIMDLAHGRVDWPILAMGAASGAALLLARPMLETAEARAEFAPVAYRRGFLRGASAAAAAGLACTTAAVVTAAHPLLAGAAWTMASAGLGVLGTAFLGSALGVLRMRTWGILLGVVASIMGMFWAAIAFGSGGASVGAAALIPAILLVAPILRARLGEPAKTGTANAGAAEPARVRVSSRVAAEAELGATPVGALDAIDDALEAGAPLTTAPAKAARWV